MPVWPYANTVPLYPSKTLSTIGLAVSLYTAVCVLFQSKTLSNVKVFGSSPDPPTGCTITCASSAQVHGCVCLSTKVGIAVTKWSPPQLTCCSCESTSTIRLRLSPVSTLLSGRHLTTTLTHSADAPSMPDEMIYAYAFEVLAMPMIE